MPSIHYQTKLHYTYLAHHVGLTRPYFYFVSIGPIVAIIEIIHPARFCPSEDEADR